MILLEKIDEEIELLVAREKSVQHELLDKPKGKLRVSKNHKKYSFFHCTKDSKGTYIKNTDVDLISKLSSKEYLEKIKNADAKTLNALEKTKEELLTYDWQKVVSEIHPAKLSFVRSNVIGDNEFANQWANTKYNKAENGLLNFPTFKGDYVRSKSEVIIANFMFEQNIYYRYEQIYRLNSGDSLVPDFTILNPHSRKVVYWEHFGMMDDPTYATHACQKIFKYQKNGLRLGIDFFFTMETSANPFSVNFISDYLLKNFKVA